ncbi:30S ribosomal protein THX [Flavobacterium arcticum]|uniref:30S ribosomal protein THX n=1 Tax=Flavobacterium arcticum TaxID=1784713 RepID=A0A345H8A6_9FLAO|nr:30S ribosomal protein THX [Flavobacterium arcticum]AXG72816.1 30S ribosomal protein THX [Flavobacterium arcticum]KAF2510519.1 30S ribosomal protein THX [Flavobacterium arcticum]
MGKGDVKTKRGKIWRGTHGVRRPKEKSSGNGDSESSDN